MPIKRSFVVCLLSCVLLITSCTAGGVVSQTERIERLTGTSSLPTSLPKDPDWRQIDTAMELRTLRLAAGNVATDCTITRLDPTAYRLSVKYDVQHAGTVREWFEALKPIAVINGGYFDAEGKATALVVFDGIRRGASYEGFGGMVVVNEQGGFEIRSLSRQPYESSENLRQAMQSAPMLIQPGGELADLQVDQDRSRRSVIGQDRAGRIVLIACNAPTFTLNELARALHESDLDLDRALNLDGGRSTGLYLQTVDANVTINSYEKVPLVLVVERLP
jgi:exopolysaccharide biosynthesis protein